MAPRFSSGKISIWFFSKCILGSYKTQTVNFKPMLCRYIHSNMLKTLMFFNIWRKNLKIQKWSSEIMSRLQKFSENNFKWWGLWCWTNHVHISSGYENICIWSSRRLLKTTLYRRYSEIPFLDIKTFSFQYPILLQKIVWYVMGMSNGSNGTQTQYPIPSS